MAELFHKGDTPQYFCWDRKYYDNVEDQLKTLAISKTIYIGNMSFYTTEVQIYETFSQAGAINRIIMGLNLITKEPCGFCFVEFFTRESAAIALNYVNNSICDDRLLRCDLDGGFRPGRQFGRGKSGGQRRDDYRTEYDPGRGDTLEVRDQINALGKRRHMSDRNDGRRRNFRPRMELRVTIDGPASNSNNNNTNAISISDALNQPLTVPRTTV